MRRLRVVGARRQRGWAGMVALLLALVIVGFLMRSVLKQMGAAEKAAGSGSAPQAAPAAAAQADRAMPPMERAKAVEAELARQASETAQRLQSLDK